ncbi:uracil-DNA glycosylase [Rossellomorea vietnamensis]|uniref:Uracil-DNA glycosylase n=1 Tax=Rossellomorea vietnamensis TaxID=218284 RepID=A0A5D4M4F9_9BACI|nr:uracil-DNA glycosylase [Bacillus sp. P14.5]TYR96774.1 uracil-DNA glycosylase [Rossellomorea vietnamensis]
MLDRETRELPEKKKINCFQCQYFYTTWEPAHPRGCKAYGFKTKAMPSLVVFRSSGESCLKYTPKGKKGK